MKKVIYLVIVVAVVLVAVVTCPDKQAHRDAVMDEVNTAIGSQLKESTGLGDTELEQGLSLIGSTIASKMIESAFESSFKVNNYFVFSTGELTYDGQSKTVSVGFLGHVFTSLNAGDMKKAIGE